MEGLGRKIIVGLAILLAIAVATRLAWTLLRPAVPFLIVVLVILMVLQMLRNRHGGW